MAAIAKINRKSIHYIRFADDLALVKDYELDVTQSKNSKLISLL